MLVSGVPRSLLPSFCSHLPLTKEVSRFCHHFSLAGYILLLPSFLLFCRRGEVNIEVKKTIEVRLVPSGLGYILTMSRIEFAN